MDWVLQSFGVLFGIVGVAIGILAYLRPPRRRKLAYHTASERYFEERDYALPEEAVMTFKGSKVPRLSKTTLIVWNAGTEVLHGKDIVPDDPIRVCFGEGDRVLSSAVIGSTKPTNKAQIQPRDPHELTLHYDYLDPRDGLVVDIMHDSWRLQPLVTGEAKGVVISPRQSRHLPNLLNIFRGLAGPWLMIWSRKATLATWVTLVIAAVIGIGFVVTGALGRLAVAVRGTEPTWFLPRLAASFDQALGLGSMDGSSVAVMFLAGTFYALPPLWVMWRARRRVPKALAPYARRTGRDGSA